MKILSLGCQCTFYRTPLLLAAKTPIFRHNASNVHYKERGRRANGSIPKGFVVIGDNGMGKPIRFSVLWWKYSASRLTGIFLFKQFRRGGNCLVLYSIPLVFYIKARGPVNACFIKMLAILPCVQKSI